MLGLASLGSTAARAHFILQSPAAVSEQGPLGDPQKAPPCGDDGSAVATGMVTSYKAGDVVTITIDETIFHPGHYRIALAINYISELPDDPPVTPNNTDCGTAPIQDPPVFPVLADGVFLHTEPFNGPQTIDVTLPADVSCDNCTLQVIQFMSNHGLNNPGGCYYHHCANIAVEGGQAGTTGSDESSGDDTTSTSTDVTTTSQDDTATPQTTADESTGNVTGATGPGTTGTSGEPTTSATGTGSGGESSSGTTANDADEGGCGCTSSGDRGPATLLAVLGLLGLRTRRKPHASR